MYGSRKKVLIVDDSLVTRGQLSRLLQADGHTTEEAANGPDALTQVDAHCFDVAVVDVNLPAMNGLQLIQQFRAQARHRDLFVLVLTTESAPHLVRQGKALDVKGWLNKPFREEQLLSAIRTAPSRQSNAPVATGSG